MRNLSHFLVIGKVLGTQPLTKELILSLRCLLLKKKHFSKAQEASLIINDVSHAKIVLT